MKKLHHMHKVGLAWIMLNQFRQEYLDRETRRLSISIPLYLLSIIG